MADNVDFSKIKTQEITNGKNASDNNVQGSLIKGFNVKLAPEQPKKDEFKPSAGTDKNSAQKNLSNYGGYIAAAAGLLTAGTVAIVSHKNIKNLKKAIDGVKKEAERESGTLRQEVEKAAKEAEKAVTENTGLKNTVQELEGKLKKAFDEIPEYVTERQNRYKKHIEESIADGKLVYDPLAAPAKEVDAYLASKSANKYLDFHMPAPVTEAADNTLAALKQESILNTLETTGRTHFEIPTVNPIKAVSDETAFIKDKAIEELGKTIKTDMTIAYGTRTNWSNEKIARDIYQNFYDGHGHTLEGVATDIVKVGDKYRIRISGKGVYGHENIQFIGAGSKVDDVYNAGGFGEGTKILSANLLSKEGTTNIRFASADWEMAYGRTEGPIDKAIMTRTLNKTKPIEGNYIEFDTDNKELVDAIVDAKDYFYHPHNMDFADFTFENKDFAFKFLGKGSDKRGNVYLTQRFEYGQNGAWEGNAREINIVYKRKPTGIDFSKGRDRTLLTADDIKELTADFAKTMDDKELIDAITALEPIWTKADNVDTHASINFLKGLLEEASRRKLGINFGENKYVAFSKCSQAVVDHLNSEGYTICHDFLSKSYMPTIKEIMSQRSAHTALQPTVKEVKQLRLLEEGISVIQDNMQKALLKKAETELSKMNFGVKFNENTSRTQIDDIIYTFVTDIAPADEVAAFIDKNIPYENYSQRYKPVGKEVAEKVSRYVNEKIKQFLETASPSRKIEFYNRLEYRTDLADRLTYDAQEAARLAKLPELLKKSDVTCPRYVFDAAAEKTENTLAEAISNTIEQQYFGHWVSRQHLEKMDFSEGISTWLHEMTHQYAGDGDMKFGYKLTDVLGGTVEAAIQNPEVSQKLSALNEIFNKVKAA